MSFLAPTELFLFTEPAGPAGMSIVLIIFVVNTLVFFPGMAVLCLRRKYRVIWFRSFYTLVPFLTFLYFFSLVQTASIVFGKPAFCEVTNVLFALFPFFIMHFILTIPTVVLQSDLNQAKLTRWQHGELSSTIFLASKFVQLKYRVGLTLVVGVGHIALYVCLRFLLRPGGDCNRASIMAYSIYIMLVVPFLLYFIFRLRTVKDPFFMRMEIVLLFLLNSPAIMIVFIYPFAPQIFPQWFDFRWVFATLSFVNIISVVFPAALTNNTFLRKMECFMGNRLDAEERQDVNSKGTIFALNQGVSVFQAVLNNAILLEEFTQFTLTEWSVENVLFYVAVEDFKITFRDTPSTAFEKARYLSGQFIKAGAHIEVNIDSELRISILNMIRDEKLSGDMFDLAQRSVYELMEKDSFPKWQKTAGFKKALEKAVDGKTSTNSAGSYNMSKRPSMVELGNI